VCYRVEMKMKRLLNASRVYALYGGSFLIDVPFSKSPYDSVKYILISLI